MIKGFIWLILLSFQDMFEWYSGFKCLWRSGYTRVSYWVRAWQNLQKWHVRPAKFQISLGICPVWSESLLSAWQKLGSLATHWAHSEDSDLSLRLAYMPLCRFCHALAHHQNKFHFYMWILLMRECQQSIHCRKPKRLYFFKLVCDLAVLRHQ